MDATHLSPIVVVALACLATVVAGVVVLQVGLEDRSRRAEHFSGGGMFSSSGHFMKMFKSDSGNHTRQKPELTNPHGLLSIEGQWGDASIKGLDGRFSGAARPNFKIKATAANRYSFTFPDDRTYTDVMATGPEGSETANVLDFGAGNVWKR